MSPLSAQRLVSQNYYNPARRMVSVGPKCRTVVRNVEKEPSKSEIISPTGKHNRFKLVRSSRAPHPPRSTDTLIKVTKYKLVKRKKNATQGTPPVNIQKEHDASSIYEPVKRSEPMDIKHMKWNASNFTQSKSKLKPANSGKKQIASQYKWTTLQSKSNHTQRSTSGTVKAREADFKFNCAILYKYAS